MNNSLVVVLVVASVLLFLFLFRRSRRDPYHIVVARYNENLSWIPRGNKYVKVYDKGPGGNLPNIGRESHTYLTYVVENYERLPDVVFFTQGNMYDHGYISWKDFILSNNEEYSYNLTYYPYGYFFYVPGSGWNNDHLPHWKGEKMPLDELGFTRWFKKYVDVNDTHKLSNGIYYWMSAIFSVSRERILSRPKEYYQTLLDYIPKHINPEVGHFLERSWFYIFNCHIL